MDTPKPDAPEAPDTQEKWAYSPEEARKLAPFLGKAKFYQMLGSGQIPSIRAGRKFIIPGKKYRAWLSGD